MEFTIDQKDPFEILAGTRCVLENAHDVSINHESIGELAELLADVLKTTKTGAKTKENLSFENTLQRCFILDALNFCFWAERDTPRFRVEWPKGKTVSGGWFALVACVDRALAEGVPLLDASYLETISASDVESIFRASEGRLPLLPQRREILQEAGHGLHTYGNGSFDNIVQACGYDAIQLTRALTAYVPSFKDTAHAAGRTVPFFKRAQICAHDVALICMAYGKKPLEHVEDLTAFADYRLPQVYRHCGALMYTPTLASLVDEQIILPSKCLMEIEIRAATIWITELVRQQLPQYTAAQLDNAAWHVSQLWRYDMKPHHRTYTIYY